MACKCSKALFVTIYADFSTKEGHLAREFFFDNAIAYDDVDVVTDEKGHQEMLKLSGQDTRPVIVVNDEVFVGFDAAALDAFLI
jgi:glutaredoxin